MMSNELEIEKMLAGIKEHSLEADDLTADHDTIIAIQAQKLMEIGYLEYEAAGYATAFYKNGDINYYICDSEKTMNKFVAQCLQDNIVPMPVKYYYKRYDLLKETTETVNTKFRYEIAEKMQEIYPRILFEAIANLTAPASTNNAYPILKEITTQLTSCFDINHLKLFGELLDMMLRARQLSQEGYLLLHQWLDKEYEKITVEPIASGIYSRTYSGFAYQKQGEEVKYFCDAYPYMAQEKQTKYLTRGYIVTPILTTTYYGDSYKQLEESKDKFLYDLQKYLGDSYIKIMKYLKILEPTVNVEKYNYYLQNLQNENKKQAVESLRYYGFLWNAER